MLKIWGRKTSSNVQKVMWALGELGLACERIDIGGPFGKNNEPPYLALNPNGLVPTMEDGGFVLWESNAIIRYLAREEGKHTLEPADPKTRASADRWMDWQSFTLAPAMTTAFVGLIRTPPEKRNHEAIYISKTQTTEAIKILDAQLGKTACVAGDAFSMGDIGVGVMAYRYWQLVPDHPPLPHLRRWYDTIAARKSFKDHVGAVPLT
jgi:glutathione S-transferase